LSKNLIIFLLSNFLPFFLPVFKTSFSLEMLQKLIEVKGESAWTCIGEKLAREIQ